MKKTLFVIAALVVLSLKFSHASTSYSVKNYMAPCSGANCDNVLNLGGTWKIRNVAVTSSAPEINAQTENVFSSASTVTLGTPDTLNHTQIATVQIKNADGDNVAAVQHVRLFVSDNSNGSGLTAQSIGNGGLLGGGSGDPSGGFTLVTGAEITNGPAPTLPGFPNGEFLTDANGTLTVRFDNTGGSGTVTGYVVVVLPTRRLLVSAALNVNF
jgi:hypothetical protein